MAIDPIGMGISGMSTGLADNSYGIGAYRNSVGMAQASSIINTAIANKENADKNNKVNDDAARKRRFDTYECQTCENRRYQDGSDDNGVSFQTPTKIDPKSAAAKVKGHEMEHVYRNQAKAEREGNEIVSQSVTLHTGICPECGKTYISGGTTRTSIRGGENKDERFNIGMKNAEKGSLLDKAV